jgi:hypothetical protein
VWETKVGELQKQIDINPWLNARLSRRKDLHEIFRYLHRAGADLDYVLFLCDVFSFWDKVRRDVGFDKRRGLIQLSPPHTKLNGQQRLSEALRPLEALKDPIKVQKLLDLKDEADMWLRGVNQLLDALSPRAEAPLLSLFVLFGWPREFYNGKGDPGDPWGNFFLLAVTEHLGSGGRGRKSKHDLAYRLLTMLRKGSVSIDNPKVSTAGRVAAVKKNPQWQAALSLLESEFSKLLHN